MNAADLLPVRRQPPNDPTFWLLDAHAGWRAAGMQHVEIGVAQGALVLARSRAGARALVEPGGSFGGLTPPSCAALDAHGRLFLLDVATAQLKLFDPCTCLFEDVLCFSGIGRSARQLLDPSGIAIANENLYVADRGNRMVKVFALHGFALRALWKPPRAAGLDGWQPAGIACDRRGRVYVGDPAHGLIHRFSPAGRWSQFVSGVGAARHLAVDCEDQLYVVTRQDPAEVRAFDAQGHPVDFDRRPDALAGRFPRLPFAMDASGDLDLTEMCLPSEGVRTPSRFDRSGNRINEIARVAPAPPSYETQGIFYTQPLDSKLYRCQWHRVVISGQVPAGAQVIVATYTAEVDAAVTDVAALPESAWETRQTTYQIGKDGWDCLVRSAGGRFLWLRLTLKSTGFMTPVIDRIQVDFPRVNLRRFLPAVFGADPVSADFTDRFLSIFDTTLRSVEDQVDAQAALFDPLSAPARSDSKAGIDFLSWLGTWVGVAVDRQLPEAKRRQMVAQAARLHQLRGTREGLWRHLLLLLGMQPANLCCATTHSATRCEPRPANCGPADQTPWAWQTPPLILEHFQLRRWLYLGAGRLGDRAEVWGQSIVNRSQLGENAQADRTQIIATQDPQRDPFHVYAHKFSVFVPARYGRDDSAHRALRNVIHASMPAHTQMFLEFVEPRFRIGFQASIGLNTVVGRYPEGVTLNETPLGPASVLGAPAQADNGPSLAVGKAARIGGTTRLT